MFFYLVLIFLIHIFYYLETEFLRKQNLNVATEECVSSESFILQQLAQTALNFFSRRCCF